MKLTSFLVLFLVAGVYGNGLAQKVSLYCQDSDLQTVIAKIKQQTKFKFFYDDELIAKAPKINIEVENKDIHEALDIVIGQTQLSYKIIAGTVSIQAGTSRNISHDSMPDQLVMGSVKDEEGKPLEGASVKIKGQKTGTITNEKGVFEIRANTGDLLVITFVGYETKEVSVNGSLALEVVLLKEQDNLDEVVVVGYGTQKKSDITGASSNVSADQIAKRPLARIEQALQGSASGVAVKSQNGQPGQALRIKIRGANSISGSNEPLYVIDGNIGKGTDVNVNDIASIDILKDAASTAIYGSRGSNGVVMITTKSGKSGTTQVHFDGWVQRNAMPKKLDLMNAYDFARSVNAQYAATGSTAPFSDADLENFRLNGGTDWQDELFTKPWVQSYQLDVSGGAEQARYRLSAGYLNQPGTIVNQYFRQASFRASIDAKLNNRINLKFIASATIPQKHNVSYGGGLSDPFNQALEWDPTSPVRDPATGNFITNSQFASIQFNPVAQALSQAADNSSTNLSGIATLTYKITDDLTFTSTDAYNMENGYGQTLMGPGTGSYSNKSDYVQVSPNRYRGYLSSNYFTYSKLLGDHSLTATALYEISGTRNTLLNALSRNLSSYALGYYNLGLGTTLQTNSDYIEESMVSYMGRVNYSFKDKYFLSASIRFDGSSHLIDKFSSFPSVGVRWNIMKEDFMKDAKILSDLSFRATYGQTGNQAVAAYSSIPMITISTTQPNYYFDGTTPSVATALGTPVSKSLKWEVKSSYDAGIDASFFNHKLDVTVDAYYSKVHDLLYSYPAPFYQGGGSYNRNIGSIENKGIELTVGGAPVSSDNFKWNTNLTFSLNRNKVLDLGGLDNVVTGGVTGQALLWVGAPLGEFYGYQFLGTWKSSEATEAAKFGMVPGDAKYVDVNGDHAYTTDDYMPIGNATPNFTFGFVNDFSYKNFSMNVMFQGSQGNQIFSQTLAYAWGGLGDMKNATLAEAVPENLWSPEHETDNPAWSNTGKNYNLSSRYVYDASFVKLKNISLNYSFPANISKRLRAKSLEIYVSGQNLFTITDFDGFDPEVEGSSNAILQGQELGVIPNPKSYTFGVRLGL